MALTTLTTLPAAEQSELEKMGCTLESEVDFFFNMFARRIAAKAPTNIGDICAKCAQRLEDDFMVGTVNEMINIVGDTQIQHVLTKAGGKATWKNLIEFVVGKSFCTTALVQTEPLVPQTVVRNAVEPTFVISPIGAQMEADGTLEDEFLPAYVLNAHFECEDPQEQDLTGPDVTNILNEYTHYMTVEKGQPAGDKRLRVHHAALLRERYPRLPRHGKTPGPARRWVKLLLERKRNLARKSGLKARAAPLTLPHPARSGPPLEASSPALPLSVHVSACAQAGAFKGIVYSQEDAECPFVKDMIKKGFNVNIDPNKPPRDKSRFEVPTKRSLLDRSDSSSNRLASGRSRGASSEVPTTPHGNSDDDDTSEDDTPLSQRRAPVKTREPMVSGRRAPRRPAQSVIPCYTACYTACYTMRSHMGSLTRRRRRTATR